MKKEVKNLDDKIAINENLILTNIDAADSKQVLYELSKKMYECGYVKNTFCEAVLKREKEFPTGLKCPKYNIAIPHTESAHVNRTCIGVATMQQGVDFQRMDEPKEAINVKLVVLLASAGGHVHIKMLGSIMKILQNETIVQQLVKSENKYEITEILQQYLLGGEE